MIANIPCNMHKLNIIIKNPEKQIVQIIFYLHLVYLVISLLKVEISKHLFLYFVVKNSKNNN